jgi:hypothetical protein
MRVPEEPVCIDIFRQNPVFTSLQLKSPVNVVPPLERRAVFFKASPLKRGLFNPVFSEVYFTWLKVYADFYSY